MQVSPSGMAAASQAVPGEFDSRHLLQKRPAPIAVRFSFGRSSVLWRESRVEPFAGANALPYGVGIMVNLTAKATIDNCRAGRAAKGATLVTV